MKRAFSVFLIVILILSVATSSFLAFVSSSTGSITINSKTTSQLGQEVQAGGTVNLYFGGVTWAGDSFWLFLSQDSSTQMGLGLIYTPTFSVYDVANTTVTTFYSNDNGNWVAGSNWINGSVPLISGIGNYYIKAIDQINSPFAVTDTYITITPILYNSTLNISPNSGPGGIPIKFTGSNYPPGQNVVISYYDPTFGDWNYFTSVTSNVTGQIMVDSEVPDLMKSMGAYDSPELYTEISFRAEINNNVYSYANYNEYHRGLNIVGNYAAYGLFGNGTDLTSDVRTKPGDTITLSGNWFHSNDAIYIRWDSLNVVGTVTSDEWLTAEVIQTTASTLNGSFSTSITIPQNVVTGEHYIAIEDSQTRITIRIFVSTASLQISPSSGPGGANVQFTGEGYPQSSTVTLYYLDFFGWSYMINTTSSLNGEISLAVEIPDLMKSGTNGQFTNVSTPLSFMAEVNGIPYAYADFSQYWRGLNQVGNQFATYGLYGNGTDLSSTVSPAPGDSIIITGSWFHPGVVYVRFDGVNVVGTVTSNEWLSAQVIGTTTASSTGSFSTSITIPTAIGGQHYLAIEDSQTRLIVKINVTAPSAITPSPSPTSAPITSPTAAPTPNPTPVPSLPTPSIDLSCKSSTTSNSFKVEINGEVTLDNYPLEDQPVLISYSVTGGNSWESLTLVQTLSDGSFKAVWTPDVTGNYLVKATVEASSIINSATRTISMALTPDPENNIFTINSNSTLRQFIFDPDNKELSFTTEGPSGTTGYVNIFIPKVILPDISTLKTYFDGEEILFNSESQGQMWLISFAYSHSAHKITMILGNSLEPADETFDMQWLIYIVVVAAIAVVVITTLALKRRSKT